MKGFNTEYGYMGFVKERWILFASENEYRDYCIELKNISNKANKKGER